MELLRRQRIRGRATNPRQEPPTPKAAGGGSRCSFGDHSASEPKGRSRSPTSTLARVGSNSAPATFWTRLVPPLAPAWTSRRPRSPCRPDRSGRAISQSTWPAHISRQGSGTPAPSRSAAATKPPSRCQSRSAPDFDVRRLDRLAKNRGGQRAGGPNLRGQPQTLAHETRNVLADDQPGQRRSHRIAGGSGLVAQPNGPGAGVPVVPPDRQRLIASGQRRSTGQ